MDGSLLPGEVLVELMLQQVYVGGDAQEHGAGDVWQDTRNARGQDQQAAAGQLAVPKLQDP